MSAIDFKPKNKTPKQTLEFSSQFMKEEIHHRRASATMNLSTSEYTRPKTAMLNNETDDNNESYYGGFFSA